MSDVVSTEDIMVSNWPLIADILTGIAWGLLEIGSKIQLTNLPINKFVTLLIDGNSKDYLSLLNITSSNLKAIYVATHYRIMYKF